MVKEREREREREPYKTLIVKCCSAVSEERSLTDNNRSDILLTLMLVLVRLLRKGEEQRDCVACVAKGRRTEGEGDRGRG